MSTAVEEAGIEFVGFEEEDAQVVDERRTLEDHYGCSPAFDIDVRDRHVLPPEGEQIIKRCALVRFRNLPYNVSAAGGELAQPDLSGAGMGAATAGKVVRRTKSAWACAEEIRHAYNASNPWGFVVFDALTGVEPRKAKDIFRLVLPRPMNIPEMIDHLETRAVFDIQEAGLPGEVLNVVDGREVNAEQIAETVRLQLLTGCHEATAFARERFDASTQEKADRQAGGKGKAKYDGWDEKLAGVLGEDLKTKPLPPPPQQQQAPALPPEVLDIITRQSEQLGRLTATVEQMRKGKPGRKAAESEAPQPEAAAAG